MGWPLWNSEDYDDIRIIDLGSAFQENSPPNGLAQARDLTAPETIFTDKFGCKQDLWCVGLLVSILLSIQGELLSKICNRLSNGLWITALPGLWWKDLYG